MADTADRVRRIHALPADGRTVETRPARPKDRLRVEKPYDRMSAESLRLRFFGAGTALGGQAVPEAREGGVWEPRGEEPGGRPPVGGVSRTAAAEARR